MKVLLTGARVCRLAPLTRLRAAGHQVLPVSRRPAAGGYDWSDASLARGVREADAVIHLAGENLFDRRWTSKQKEFLRSSRTQPTTKLAKLVAARNPSCLHEFVSCRVLRRQQGRAFRRILSPRTGVSRRPLRRVGSIDVGGRGCRRADRHRPDGNRARTGGGALGKMLLPFKLGLGGPTGHGKQWMSWIHLDDLTGLFQFLLENPAHPARLTPRLRNRSR